MTEIKIQLAN